MNIRELFKTAAEKGASDLHLVVGLNPSLRIDGNLTYLEDKKKITNKEMEQMVFSLLDTQQKERFISTKELDLGLMIENYRFRVNLHFEKGNVGLAARVINDKIPSLEEINMPEIIYRLVNLRQGLIVVTGPTGCGKTTTLAAMIDYINENRFCNIITLEDPIEYLFQPKKSIIIQRELGNDMLSFSSGLNS